MHKFDEYEHSIPIIYSSLEGQYKSDMLEVSEGTYILCTSFDFNYIGGDIPSNIDSLVDIINQYVRNKNKKEFILFAPNSNWDPILETAFKKLNGIIDKRSIYDLDISLFREIYDNYEFQYDVTIIQEQDNQSNFPYPVAVIKEGDNILSFCKGFMIGKGNVEIDVFTDKVYRRKGFAFEVSLKLIKYLLEKGYTPNWTCWKAKNSSKLLAERLGFIHRQDITAYIWLEELK